jgi:hypothetical protein
MGFEGADIGLHNIGELIPDLLWQWGWRVHKNVSYATLTLTGKKVLDHLPERLRHGNSSRSFAWFSSVQSGKTRLRKRTVAAGNRNTA